MTTAMHGDPDPRPVLITGGPIHPMDGDPVPREAVVIRQGRVAGTGTREEMRSLAGSDGRALNVEGAAVLPGLVDTHPHLLHFNARSGMLVDISDSCETVALAETQVLLTLLAGLPVHDAGALRFGGLTAGAGLGAAVSCAVKGSVSSFPPFAKGGKGHSRQAEKLCRKG